MNLQPSCRISVCTALLTLLMMIADSTLSKRPLLKFNVALFTELYFSSGSYFRPVLLYCVIGYHIDWSGYYLMLSLVTS